MKLKNKNDLEQIKKAIKIGMGALDSIKEFVQKGTTTKALSNLIDWYINNHDATPSFKNYKGFPEACCISINKEIIHGIPSERKLKDGDIVKIDVGVNYKGYYSDQARTYIVGKSKRKKHEFLIQVTKLALYKAKKIAKAGRLLSDVGWYIEFIAKIYGLGILKDYFGHGVGFAVHEKPKVENIYNPNDKTILKKGMVLAIEPMFVLGKGTYKIDKNNWTVIADGLSAHFEETIII